MTTDLRQRREVTDQARRCIRSSWDECDDAVKMETRVLSNKARRTLKRHLDASCPETEFVNGIEIFVPSRIIRMVSNNSMSLDLTENWNLFCREDRLTAWRYIRYFKRIVGIFSPECKGFSTVMNANLGKMSADQVDYIMDTCFAMLVFSIQVAIHQVDNNIFYILEHPYGAFSWS